MKKNTIIIVLMLTMAGAALMSSCDSKREPGKIYMPDMGYSRAIETYSELDSNYFTTDKANPGDEIYYNRMPVPGTIARGELFPYTLPNDSVGYRLSAQVKNPLPPLTGADSVETARLFNVNCAICHGPKAQGNGPLSTSGKIGAIANLTLPVYVEKADGTLFHVITYGKNNMGSYAPQLSRKQRWQIVHYIRNLQPKATTASSSAASDSSAAKK